MIEIDTKNLNNGFILSEMFNSKHIIFLDIY